LFRKRKKKKRKKRKERKRTEEKYPESSGNGKLLLHGLSTLIILLNLDLDEGLDEGNVAGGEGGKHELGSLILVLVKEALDLVGHLTGIVPDSKVGGGLPGLDEVLVLLVLFVDLGQEGLVSSLGEASLLIEQREHSELVLISKKPKIKKRKKKKRKRKEKTKKIGQERKRRKKKEKKKGTSKRSMHSALSTKSIFDQEMSSFSYSACSSLKM